MVDFDSKCEKKQMKTFLTPKHISFATIMLSTFIMRAAFANGAPYTDILTPVAYYIIFTVISIVIGGVLIAFLIVIPRRKKRDKK